MVLLHPLAAIAEDSLWVRNVTARASMEERTQVQARNRALQLARDEAVRSAFGTTILSNFLMNQSELVRNGKIEHANDDAVKFILESAGARVLKEVVLSEGAENTAREGAKPRYDYVVAIDALVVKDKGNPDPDFAITVNSVRESYRHGDKMTLELIATQDCYVNVFSLGADGLVYHVFPNSYEKGNRLREGIRRTIPGSSMYSLSVELPEGKNAASETILVVATKDSTSFRLGDPFKAGVEYAEQRRSALEQLMGWIFQLPRNRVAEAAESYLIRR